MTKCPTCGYTYKGKRTVVRKAGSRRSVAIAGTSTRVSMNKGEGEG